jgi:Arc/MetJ-type ribon-helix-helix transcriptional regulator
MPHFVATHFSGTTREHAGDFAVIRWEQWRFRSLPIRKRLSVVRLRLVGTRRAEDAVRDALARWEEGERTRAELLSALDEAETDLESGRFSDHSDESLPELAAELKREARAQLRSRELHCDHNTD